MGLAVLPTDGIRQILDSLSKGGIVFTPLLNSVYSVDDRAVIAVAEVQADGSEVTADETPD